MLGKKIQRIKTITEYHNSRDLPKPQHPLISLIDYSTIRHSPENNSVSWVFDFYSIALKRNFAAKIKYGQSDYDFDGGVLFFIAPGQVFTILAEKESDHKRSGWMLLVHPDFLLHAPLSKKIKQYDYFGYSVNEALFLSEKEETILTGILQQMQQEYHSNIDAFSQELIVAQLELLLIYAERFYHRQFITRKIPNHRILNQLEDLLTQYFNSEALSANGLPTVQYIAEALHVSPNYLSNLLNVLTGRSTQQHIHDRLIDKAKEQLTTTTLTVSEIAYTLGFEHTQSFSRLFKSKTKKSPGQFRQSFN